MVALCAGRDLVYIRIHSTNHVVGQKAQLQEEWNDWPYQGEDHVTNSPEIEQNNSNLRRDT